MAFPPPDQPYDLPTPVTVDPVYVHIVGYIHEEEDVEVLARSGDSFYRFYLPKTARVVRKFWQSIGVTNILKLPEGAYDSKEGLGPFTLYGMAIGEDVPDPEPEDEATTGDEPADVPEGGDAPDPVKSVGTVVLMGVRLEGG